VSRRGSRGPRAVSRVLAAVGLLGALLAVPGTSARAATTTTAAVTPVTLNGEGSWDPFREVTDWQNDLYGANGLVNVNYTPNGGFQGRQDYVAGQVDFAISGTPFTSAELAQLSGGAQSYIEAPVFVGAIGMAVVPPYVTGQSAEESPPNDHGWIVFRETCDDGSDGTTPTFPDNPSQCDTETPYLGPVRLPAANLASMLFGAPGASTFPPPYYWDAAGILNAWGITQGSDYGPPDLVQTDEDFVPFVVGRADASETDYYLQEYVKQAAPTVWSGVVKEAASLGETIDPIQETLPLFVLGQLPSQLRDGVEQQSLYAIEPPDGSATEAQGAIVPVPPSALGFMQGLQIPNSQGSGVLQEATKSVEWAEIQNGNGDWVTPTPTSIDAAVDAGDGDTPLAALGTSIPGAYPLVYIDNLYAPAHGLSIAKTEALATTIRYLATAGQAYDAGFGDGQLSPALVDKALAAANQLVLDNCVGSGTQLLSSSDPGPYAPAGTLTTIGPMLHCEAAVPPATTTTSTTVASASAAGESITTQATSVTSSDTIAPTISFGDTSGDSNGGSATVAPPTASSGGSTGSPSPTSAPQIKALTISELPLPLPGTTGSTFDRLATMVAGAALLLLVLKVAKAVARGLGL